MISVSLYCGISQFMLSQSQILPPQKYPLYGISYYSFHLYTITMSVLSASTNVRSRDGSAKDKKLQPQHYNTNIPCDVHSYNSYMHATMPDITYYCSSDYRCIKMHVWVGVCTLRCVHVYVCMCVCVYVHVCACVVCMCVRMCVCVETQLTQEQSLIHQT